MQLTGNLDIEVLCPPVQGQVCALQKHWCAQGFLWTVFVKEELELPTCPPIGTDQCCSVYSHMATELSLFDVMGSQP